VGCEVGSDCVSCGHSGTHGLGDTALSGVVVRCDLIALSRRAKRRKHNAVMYLAVLAGEHPTSSAPSAIAVVRS
jgi:hypothetical protein